VHYPWTRCGQSRAGAVGTDRCDHSIFGDIAVRGGNHALNESAPRARRWCPHDVGTHQQVHRILGDYSAAAAGGAFARCGRTHVKWIDRINPAIFQNPNVRVDRGPVKINRNGVQARQGSRNILCKVNSLGE
jgi:hypothetical protein